MEKRPSRLGQTDQYMSARQGIQQKTDKFEFVWLEVVEGKKPDAIDYVIHGSNNAAAVPPFAVEHYERGALMGYETSKQKLNELALMPEELRARIVQAQMATSAISMSEPKQARVAMPG